MKQEQNFPTTDLCYEQEEDKEEEKWTHKIIIIETIITIMEMAEMKIKMKITKNKTRKEKEMIIKKKIKMKNKIRTMNNKEV